MKTRLVYTFLKLYFITFLLSRGKINGQLKFQPYLVSAFGVVVIDNKKSKTIDLYRAYAEKITGAYLIDHNYVSSATGYGVGT